MDLTTIKTDFEAVLGRTGVWLQELKVNASENSSTWWGWIWKILVAGVLMVGIGYLIWKWNKQNNELRDLRTQTEQKKVIDLLALITAEKDKTEAEVKMLQDANAVKQKINADILADLNQRITKHDIDKTVIEHIKSWDELDSLMASR